MIPGTAAVVEGDAGSTIVSVPVTLSEPSTKTVTVDWATMDHQATGGDARIELGAWQDQDSVYFTVTDDGPGIAGDVLPHLFEPFFTTRPQGTGLGLAVVQDVAKSHGGEVNAHALSKGARFTMRLPIAAGANVGACDD